MVKNPRTALLRQARYRTVGIVVAALSGTGLLAGTIATTQASAQDTSVPGTNRNDWTSQQSPGQTRPGSSGSGILPGTSGNANGATNAS